MLLRASPPSVCLTLTLTLTATLTQLLLRAARASVCAGCVLSGGRWV